MRTLFLATYFSVLFMLNSLNFTWLCVFGQPSFHGIYRYSKDLRLLHSILFRKVRGQHSKEQSEVLAYIPAFVCSLSCRVPEIARGNLGCLTNSIRSSPSSRAVLLLANELLVYVVWVVVSSFPTPCPLLKMRLVWYLSLLPVGFGTWRSATERTPSTAPEKSPLWGISASIELNKDIYRTSVGFRWRLGILSIPS